MMNEEKINLVKNIWKEAAERYGFNFITPFNENIESNNVLGFVNAKEIKKGIIIGLIGPPHYDTDDSIIEWAKENNSQCSFININSCLKFNEPYFDELLEDWGIRSSENPTDK